MKRLLFLFTGMLLIMQHSYSQQRDVWVEDFDGNMPGWTASPPAAWRANTVLTLPGSNITNPKSLLGLVPTNVGDSVTLETAIYDCSDYDYIIMSFSHICKIALTDELRIEYREDVGTGFMGRWQLLPRTAYNGASAAYNNGRFNAASYPTDWQSTNNLALPTQTWWKEEVFILDDVVPRGIIQFRFVLKHGNTAGTQAAYGWLIENFSVVAADYQIIPPTVQFVAPFKMDIIYSTGPHNINAKVKTNSYAPIEIPFLKYTAILNGITIAGDSIEMDMVRGDSLWVATIPQFELGTKIVYSITGKDTLGNEATAFSEYTITLPPPGETGYVQIPTVLGNTTSTYPPITTFYTNGWSRQIYLASELSSTSAGGMITELAWDYNYATPVVRTTQNCYFKAVSAATVVTGYVDPIADGATLVWSGTYNLPAGRTWANIVLDVPFLLLPGENLMVYWTNVNCTYNTSATFNLHTQQTYMTVAGGNDASWASAIAAAGSLYYTRPNARFYFVGGTSDSSAAAMVSIDMPDTVNMLPTSLCLLWLR